MGAFLEFDGAGLWPSAAHSARALAPDCSFRDFDLAAPNITLQTNSGPVRYPLGRGEEWRSYVGLKMWSSRGIGHRRAIAAMLGDDSAYYESPLFTAIKLMALGRIHELSKHVFPTTGDGGWQDERLIHGYTEFWREVTARAFNNEYMRLMPEATGEAAAAEAEAAALAKALVDDAFDMSAERFHEKYMARDGLEDTYFALYSSLSYRKAFYSYGRDWVGSSPPGLLVLSPAARDRGLDYGFCIMREVYSGHYSWSDASWRSNQENPVFDPAELDFLGLRRFGDGDARTVIDGFFPDLCLCEESDFTELLTPGYHLPQHVEGLDWDGLAFYRLVLPRTGAAAASGEGEEDFSFVAVLRGENRCVARPSGTFSGPFFFCSEEECTADESYCGPTPITLLQPLQPVPAVAVIYASTVAAPGSSGAGADEARRWQEERARELLGELNSFQAASSLPVAPLEGPVLVSLQDFKIEAALGGREASRPVAALLLGKGGHLTGVTMDAAAAFGRPSAEAVLAARAAAAGAATGAP